MRHLDKGNKRPIDKDMEDAKRSASKRFDVLMKERQENLKAKQLEQELAQTKERLAEAEKLISEALKAVESLDEGALGYVYDTPDQQGWIIRDELAYRLGNFLTNKQEGE